MAVVALRTALEEANLHGVELSESIDGTIRAWPKRPFNYARLAPVLHCHDLELKIAPEGPLSFAVISEISRNAHEPISSLDVREIKSGPVRRCVHSNVTACSAQLAKLLLDPTVLSVLVFQNGITVDYILPSDIKNGLAHRKRRGLTKPMRAPSPWPTTSKTQRRATKCVRASRSWQSLIFGR